MGSGGDAWVGGYRMANRVHIPAIPIHPTTPLPDQQQTPVQVQRPTWTFLTKPQTKVLVFWELVSHSWWRQSTRGAAFRQMAPLSSLPSSSCCEALKLKYLSWSHLVALSWSELEVRAELETRWRCLPRALDDTAQGPPSMPGWIPESNIWLLHSVVISSGPLYTWKFSPCIIWTSTDQISQKWLKSDKRQNYVEPKRHYLLGLVSKRLFTHQNWLSSAWFQMEEIECSNQARHRLGVTFNYIFVQIRDTTGASRLGVAFNCYLLMKTLRHRDLVNLLLPLHGCHHQPLPLQLPVRQKLSVGSSSLTLSHRAFPPLRWIFDWKNICICIWSVACSSHLYSFLLGFIKGTTLSFSFWSFWRRRRMAYCSWIWSFIFVDTIFSWHLTFGPKYFCRFFSEHKQHPFLSMHKAWAEKLLAKFCIFLKRHNNTPEGLQTERSFASKYFPTHCRLVFLKVKQTQVAFYCQKLIFTAGSKLE